MLHTPEFISGLKRNEVFVFGSNTNGEHYGGAAGWSVNEIKSIFWKAVKTTYKSETISNNKLFRWTL